MTTTDRTEPGVCTRCGDTRLIPIGDGYSVNPCPNCTGQQPAQPDKSHVTYNSDGSVQIDVRPAVQQYVRNRRQREYPKDPVLNGVVQTAQPDSGERIRPRGRLICADCRNEFIDPWSCTTCGAQKLYDETVRQQAAGIDRLQSALTAAQREKEQKEFELVHALETLDIERQQLAAEREARQQHANAIWQQGEEIVSLRQQLTAAQREIADLRNRLNLSEKRQGRFPQDAVQPKEPS